MQIGPKAFGNGLASLLQVAGPLGVAAVKLLLESGADATLQGSHRITALQRAEKNQRSGQQQRHTR